MEQKEKNAYRYRLRYKGKIVRRGITYDLNRREASHQLEFPGSRIEQIGPPVTWLEASKWERKQKTY